MEYFEDISVGDEQEFGNYTVDQEEIISFAEQYDPQPFHTSESDAKESEFEGLIASGIHTLAILQRMATENILRDSSAQGALGIEDLRWKQPVRPGDTLTVKTKVLEKKPWLDGFGVVKYKAKVYDQNQKELLSLVELVRYRTRDST